MYPELYTEEELTLARSASSFLEARKLTGSLAACLLAFPEPTFQELLEGTYYMVYRDMILQGISIPSLEEANRNGWFTQWTLKDLMHLAKWDHPELQVITAGLYEKFTQG